MSALCFVKDLILWQVVTTVAQNTSIQLQVALRLRVTHAEAGVISVKAETMCSLTIISGSIRGESCCQRHDKSRRDAQRF
jgi:hypothetical protein